MGGIPFQFPLGKNPLKKTIFSIKHDPETSCFQLRPKIGDKGDKILARSCFILKFLKSEANFDAERGILVQNVNF